MENIEGMKPARAAKARQAVAPRTQARAPYEAPRLELCLVDGEAVCDNGYVTGSDVADNDVDFSTLLG